MKNDLLSRSKFLSNRSTTVNIQQDRSTSFEKYSKHDGYSRMSKLLEHSYTTNKKPYHLNNASSDEIKKPYMRSVFL